MNAQRFCDWLQGYVEIDGNVPTEVQWQIIKDHLDLVYNKVTPVRTQVGQVTDQLARPELPLKAPETPLRPFPTFDWSKISPNISPTLGTQIIC